MNFFLNLLKRTVETGYVEFNIPYYFTCYFFDNVTTQSIVDFVKTNDPSCIEVDVVLLSAKLKPLKPFNNVDGYNGIVVSKKCLIKYGDELYKTYKKIERFNKKNSPVKLVHLGGVFTTKFNLEKS